MSQTSAAKTASADLVELRVAPRRSILVADEAGLVMGKRRVEGHLIDYAIRSPKKSLPPGTLFRVPAAEARWLLDLGHAVLPDDYVAAPTPFAGPSAGVGNLR